MKTKYNPSTFEPQWQQTWESNGQYLTSESKKKPKYYCLDFFPYPSGEGLHVGHCRNYIPTDVISRYMRMRGYNVLHPMGWDAFGEPAEQYAIIHGVHPRITTDLNTANYKRQMQLIGTSYDWSREIDSSSPTYYRWTQWFFLMLYQQGLAYRDTNWQWWCPTCATTLSSHEVNGDVCWRGHTGVTKRKIPAWYFKITAYADDLLDGLDNLNWPESIKLMQRNWIGRSEGFEIDFYTPEGQIIPVFTTRPDTVFGATYLALAPEHDLLASITTPENKAKVIKYQEEALRNSVMERTTEGRTKTGVFTGTYAINPINDSPVPIYVADYVLSNLGTGAIMGVPAHDQRDFEFAKVHNLPIQVVITPNPDQDNQLYTAFTEPGYLINSGPFNGLTNVEGSHKISKHLESLAKGRKKVTYQMRDWLISRQRYWGTPIPIVYCSKCGEVPVPESQLPVKLPDMDDFAPDGTGRSPLARVPEFVQTKCPNCDEPAERETDTMGGFACSSWYFLRFPNPNFDAGPFSPGKIRYWLPVDLYVGGAEHAVLHLLYSRFWTRAMFDAGIISFQEPFTQLVNQGMLHGPDGSRMSKSRGNVITPDEIVATYGADSLRIYSLFMAPFEQDVTWSGKGIAGARRFLNRLWDLYLKTYQKCSTADDSDLELARTIHQTIREATKRVENFRFNTMISLYMEFLNTLETYLAKKDWCTATYHQALDIFLLLLAPSAPYIAEELWHQTNHKGSIHEQSWPTWDEEIARDDMIEIPIQVNGKVRETLTINANWSKEKVESLVLDSDTIQKYLDGQYVSRIIYVPGKILNVVTTKRN